MVSLLERITACNKTLNDIPRRLGIIALVLTLCLITVRLFPYFWPFALALYIMRGTLEILKKTHELGYIHCDVSPINSFLRSDGSVCLIDWGNAADLAGSTCWYSS